MTDESKNISAADEGDAPSSTNSISKPYSQINISGIVDAANQTIYSYMFTLADNANGSSSDKIT